MPYDCSGGCWLPNIAKQPPAMMLSIKNDDAPVFPESDS